MIDSEYITTRISKIEEMLETQGFKLVSSRPGVLYGSHTRIGFDSEKCPAHIPESAKSEHELRILRHTERVQAELLKQNTGPNKHTGLTIRKTCRKCKAITDLAGKAAREQGWYHSKGDWICGGCRINRENKKPYIVGVIGEV